MVLEGGGGRKRLPGSFGAAAGTEATSGAQSHYSCTGSVAPARATTRGLLTGGLVSVPLSPVPGAPSAMAVLLWTQKAQNSLLKVVVLMVGPRHRGTLIQSDERQNVGGGGGRHKGWRFLQPRFCPNPRPPQSVSHNLRHDLVVRKNCCLFPVFVCFYSGGTSTRSKSSVQPCPHRPVIPRHKEAQKKSLSSRLLSTRSLRKMCMTALVENFVSDVFR